MNRQSIYKQINRQTYRMNKFYDQYKNLFVDQTKTPYLKQSINNYNSNIPTLSSPYTIIKPITLSQNHNQNELKSLFKKYADRQSTDSFIANTNKKPYESVATKELATVILPKLKMYDQEIDSRLKRFKTENQEQSYINNNSLANHNNYSFLKDYNNNNYSSVNNNNDYEVQHSRYKHGYKFKAPYNNIFHKDYDNYTKPHSNSFVHNQPPLYNRSKQQPSKPTAKNIIYPKRSNNNIFPQEQAEQNPQTINEKKVNRSRIKRKSPIFYMKHNPEENLQTQYQRSYSNKKLPSFTDDQHKELMSSRVKEISQNKIRNYHQKERKKQKIDSSFKTPKKQHIRIENIKSNNSNRQAFAQNNEYSKQQSQQGYSGNNNTTSPSATNNTASPNTHNTDNKNHKQRIMTQASSPQQPSHNKYYQSLKPFRKGSHRLSSNKQLVTQQQQIIAIKQEGMKFSQYQNQYAFINKRLQDIYNFNNFYTHKYINSYKLAIINRLQAKKNMQSRRNSLRFMLQKEALKNDEGLDE